MDNTVQLSRNRSTSIQKGILIFIILSIVFTVAESRFDILLKIKNLISFVNKIETVKEVAEEVENELSEIEEIKRQASEIKEKLNADKNSVTIKNDDGHIRYDLDGKGHGNIETPHKHIYKNNLVKSEIKSITEISESPVFMNKSDLEIVKNYLSPTIK